MRPFDLWLDEGYGYYLTTHPEDLSNEAVALFRSWLIARFAGGAAAPRPSSKAPRRSGKAARRKVKRLRAGLAELACRNAILARGAGRGGR